MKAKKENTEMFNARVWKDLLKHDRKMQTRKRNDKYLAAAAAPLKAGIPPLVTGAPQLPAGTKPKNWCAQAAIASVVDAWGKNPFKGAGRLSQLLTDVYKRFPPDVMDGNWGTSPFRIVSALKAYGLKNTVDLFLEPWHFGGFMNPANQPAWQAYRANIEYSIINSGKPVIVLVDSGKVGGDWWNLHWLICYKVNATTVELCHGFNARKGYDYIRINIDQFHQAWECNFVPIPGLRFNTVVPLP